MTVSTTLNKIIYAGDGATTVFPFTFPAVAASDIQVFFTDTLGNITLLSPTVYTLSLNPVTGTNPTAAGGSVTYNPSGTPIALGTKLTIMRTLPVTQGTSLTNQGTLYQAVMEGALDYGVMLVQQALEIQNRALVVSVSDPTPGNLPSATSRANQVLGFDGSGNPIAVSSLPAGTVSSAMAPVVNAATLAAGRTALGLGAVATEGIGGGLQDDGVGNLRTFYHEVTDSTGQSVVASFHANVRYASAAVTYTFPLTSTLFNGFGFFIQAGVAAVTLAINAADAFIGMATGASLVIPPGARVFVVTNGAGTWFVHGLRQIGFTTPENLSIVASVAASALTIALKDANGNDPSAASPVIFTVSTGGGSTQRAVTGPLSITVPSGASLGTVNAQAGRIWIGLFDNAGTPILGVYNTLNSTGPSILPWDETAAQTTTAISAGSTSPQVWYTSSGLTTKNFRIIGYVEATEATAGTWATAPSKAQLFGPGVKRPGDIVNAYSFLNAGPASTTSATFVVLMSISATISSAPNLVEVQSVGWGKETGGQLGIFQLSRGTTPASGLFGPQSQLQAQAAASAATVALLGYDIPGAGSVTYAVQGNVTSAGPVQIANNQMVVKEIQV